jgi:glycerophosphoryl diester phosphodiesterase
MVHRGEAGQAPENTRPALARCIEDGLEWAEIDLRLTKDGQLVLSHDSQVPAGTNGVWKVKERSLAELLQLGHSAGLKVQTKNLDTWDRPEFWDKVVEAGVDWVQTDLPEEFLARAVWRRLSTRPCRISHHRGANRYAPENTLPGF